MTNCRCVASENQSSREPSCSSWPGLHHELTESYVAWREEPAAVHRAHAWWRVAWAVDSWRAFEAYRAALGREEHAPRIYAELVDRAARLGSLAEDLHDGQR
jgi:hypothetical protein